MPEVYARVVSLCDMTHCITRMCDMAFSNASHNACMRPAKFVHVYTYYPISIFENNKSNLHHTSLGSVEVTHFK